MLSPAVGQSGARPGPMQDAVAAMIVTEAVERYLESLRAEPDDVLAAMEHHAARDGIPIVVPPTGALLHVLTAATGARRVLEIGTAIGVSTLYIARALPPDGTIVTFDIDEQRLAAARDYLARAGVLELVQLHHQDAREGLRELTGPFDLAFIDGTKIEYGDYLAQLVPMLRTGGLLVVDNVLMSGTVAEGHGDGHWSDQQVATAREFNEQLLSHPLLSTTITPIGDGVALAARR